MPAVDTCCACTLCFAAGKWDVGMATPDHTPEGRGYHTGMNYFHHDNDYWSMAYQLKCNVSGKVSNMIDLWRKPPSATGEPAHGYNNTCTTMNPAGGCPSTCVPGADGDRWWGGYEDSLLEQQLLRMLDRHQPEVPLFVFWAPHIAHAPLQAPQHFIDLFDFMEPSDQPTHTRRV